MGQRGRPRKTFKTSFIQTFCTCFFGEAVSGFDVDMLRGEVIKKIKTDTQNEGHRFFLNPKNLFSFVLCI